MKSIHIESDYQAAPAETEALWAAPEGGPAANQLEVLTLTVAHRIKAGWVQW